VRNETITLYKKRGEALASRDPGDTVDNEYEILSDTIGEDGTRILQLKPKDLTELRKVTQEVVNAIAEKIGEGKSKAFKALLFDVLKSYRHQDIYRMHRKLAKEGIPVKVSKACFEVIIGDGRRKNSEIIRLA